MFLVKLWEKISSFFLMAFLIIGLPFAMIAALFGVAFGDGSGNESGMAEFFELAYRAGRIFVIMLVLMIAAALGWWFLR